MAETKLRKSQAVIILSGIALSALTILPVLLHLWDALTWGTSLQSAEYDSWWTTVFGASLFAGLGIYLWVFFISIWTVRITDEGVWKRHFLEWRFIAWKNVTYAEYIPYGLNIYEYKKKITINLVIFSSIEDVTSFISERISSSVLR